MATRKVPQKAEVPKASTQQIPVQNVMSVPTQAIPKTSELSTEVKIPTRGIFYENGVDTFILRPMKVMEEKIMTTIRLVRTGEALDKILQNCLEYPKIPIKELKLADKSYLIIALRQLSYGDNYQFSLQCPSCGEVYNDEIDLSKLPISYIPEGTTENDLTVVLPQCGKNIQFRLLNGYDEQKINQKKKNRAKYSNIKELYDESYVDRLMSSIVSVDDEQLSEKELHDFVENLSVIDSQELRDKIKEFSAGIDIEIESDCPMCNHYDVLLMPLDVNFFRSSRKRNKTRRNK